MSLKRLKRNLRKQTPGLSGKVEVVRDEGSQSDQADPDVLSYVNDFIKSYSQIPPLPATSLLTREDAERALVVLEGAQKQIDTHLKTARALKRLLQSQGDK